MGEASPGGGAALGDGDGAAVVLLEQAALLTVRSRAGRRPGAAEPIAPAPAESAPAVPPAAAARLELMLAGEQARMLPEWLAAAAARELRAPARLLPDLLERGRADRALRPSLARVAGRRGVWLALQNTDWAYLLAAGDDPGDDSLVWETGSRNQRVGRLARLRGTDPAAARELLAGTWGREPAPDRAAFLGTFARGLSPADEEFLEAALDDRGKDVRQLAADLLARLPGSAYGRRMAARARDCLRAEQRTARGRRRLTIVVREPEGHDEEMARDGVPFHPPGSFAPGRRTGARAGWLREILARAPLATWTELFGLPPREAARLPVADGRAGDVFSGWARAAVRQGDAAWARALLTEFPTVAEDIDELAELLGVLPAAERETIGAGLIRGVRQIDDVNDMARTLERIRGPWTGALADAVVDILAEVLAGRLGNWSTGPQGKRDWAMLSMLCRLADERLDPAAAPRLEELAAREPDGWPLTELTGTLSFRRDMLRELA